MSFFELTQRVWGPSSPSESAGIAQVAFRSIVVFMIGLVLVRLGKSRLLSRTSSLDMLLGVILGSLLGRAITGTASLANTVAACTTLVGIHWLFSAVAVRFHWFGNIVKGHSRLLVSEGTVLWENLRRSHLTQHDLLEQMRLNANVDNLAEVESAYKERSGEIGVVKRPSAPQITSVDVQNGVQTVRIELSYSR